MIRDHFATAVSDLCMPSIFATPRTRTRCGSRTAHHSSGGGVVLLARFSSPGDARSGVRQARRAGPLPDHLGEEPFRPDAYAVRVAARALPDGLAQGQQAEEARGAGPEHRLGTRHPRQRPRAPRSSDPQAAGGLRDPDAAAHASGGGGCGVRALRGQRHAAHRRRAAWEALCRARTAPEDVRLTGTCCRSSSARR